MKEHIAILQPEIPHYRKEFFQYIDKQCEESDIYVYNSFNSARKQGFDIVNQGIKCLYSIKCHGFLIYNPLPFISKKYDILILMLHFAHVTTWFLLLTKWLHRKRIILWGQGISVKRYLQEEKKPDWKLKWQIALADGVWIYTEKEANQWRKVFPNKPIVALNNTLSGASDMTEFHPVESKEELKHKYKIKQEIILIFCARFESNYRRTDLLEEAIRRLDTDKYGFIVIGAGKNKPDFSIYDNVYDFGAVYDDSIKQELFYMANLYFQPGWVGLSIVEAMAYGKPICTFIRSEETKQCVEYSYIKEGENGLIFRDIDDCVNRIESLSQEDIERMGENARSLVKRSLMPQQMGERALSIL